MDVQEFAIWYSSFCFAEEARCTNFRDFDFTSRLWQLIELASISLQVTVKPEVRETRELARHMGLEISGLAKVCQHGRFVVQGFPAFGQCVA